MCMQKRLEDESRLTALRLEFETQQRTMAEAHAREDAEFKQQIFEPSQCNLKKDVLSIRNDSCVYNNSSSFKLLYASISKKLRCF